MSLTLSMLVAFGAMVVAFVAVGDLVLERRQVFMQLRSLRKIELTPTDVRDRELATPFFRRVLVPTIRRFGKFGGRFTPASVVDRLGKELVYAGSPPGWDAERVLAMKILSTLAFGVLGLVGAKVAGWAVVRVVIAGAFMAFIGYYIPEWVLRSRSGSRQDMIQRALPDALDLLSITVEAGLGFDAALARVARQEGGPLGEELHRVLQEMQFGKGRGEALRDLGERTTIGELKSFVLAMIQADVFGVSVSKVLQVQAHEMRLKRRQRAEERAQKIPVKIIFPLIFCIFPSLFVVILGPAVIQIRKSFGLG
jgi:tight adherence protein C